MVWPNPNRPMVGPLEDLSLLYYDDDEELEGDSTLQHVCDTDPYTNLSGNRRSRCGIPWWVSSSLRKSCSRSKIRT